MQKLCVCTLTLFSSQLQYRNSNSYFNLLLLISGDISSNPSPLHNDQLQPQVEQSVFNSRGASTLTVCYLKSTNLEIFPNHLFTKCCIIDISELKLGDSILSSETHIDNYNSLRCDRNRHDEGVVCYIRSNLRL